MKWILGISDGELYKTLTLRPESGAWYYEISPLTFGRARINLTDGQFVKNGW